MQAFRASILHFLDDPDLVGEADSYQYFEDGILLVKDGQIEAVGNADELLAAHPEARLHNFENALITPGFIDTHIHYPQTEIIAAYGEQLLEWLETYTYPAETKFADRTYARSMAERFLDELLRCGTTTALVFGTVHPGSVDAFFEACEQRELRMIAGKVLMDRNAPDELLDTAEQGYLDSKNLIEKWHGRGRLSYAVTPRFAATSTPRQLQLAGRLLREHPGVFLQTHLSENSTELRWVEELYPGSKHYLDVYDQAGLTGRRSVFAHCLHLCGGEWRRLAETSSNIAFCPASNLFLGSGLFKLKRAVAEGVCVGLGTDVGAGPSFSILQTLADAYKTQQLQEYSLTPFKAFYLATLGGARCLDSEHLIGNFAAGKEADFLVLDKAASPLLEYRMRHCDSLAEQLFVLAMLGDDRMTGAVYVAGRLAYRK